jgi:hypothetical protein
MTDVDVGSSALLAFWDDVKIEMRHELRHFLLNGLSEARRLFFDFP